MALLARIPSGRAGRMWLRRRLGAAERGRDQLDRKLRILVPEQQRLRILADGCQRDWLAACDDAKVWMLRATLLGGQDAIRYAAAPEPADVEVTWTTSLGVRYPAAAGLASLSAEVPGVSGNAAIVPATVAYKKALVTGVRAAAAREALHRIEAEIAVTRRRVRALDRRWLPQLREALAVLEQSLVQAEQEDAVRLRRAAGQAQVGGHRGAAPSR
jgi:V/A-type H+-transporting ATPase subunit D